MTTANRRIKRYTQGTIKLFWERPLYSGQRKGICRYGIRIETHIHTATGTEMAEEKCFAMYK